VLRWSERSIKEFNIETQKSKRRIQESKENKKE
jgi:hypothetical protein